MQLRLLEIKLQAKIGGLAHLARALAWQARGGRFESDILHQSEQHQIFGLLFALLFITLFK